MTLGNLLQTMWNKNNFVSVMKGTNHWGRTAKVFLEKEEYRALLQNKVDTWFSLDGNRIHVDLEFKIKR